MINQAIIRVFMLCALIVPVANRAMENEEKIEWSAEEELKGGPQPLSEGAQEKPTFAQVCVEESLRAAPWAIPVAVASYYTFPSLVTPVVNYAKENTAYIANTAALTAWNGFVLHNLCQVVKERQKGNPRPDKRFSKGWILLFPILNAALVTTITDSKLARATAWSIAGLSMIDAALEDHRDLEDRRALRKLKDSAHSLENDTEILKTQTKSINYCSDPAYTNILLSRQAEIIKKASAFRKNYTALSEANWLSSDDKKRYNGIIVEYERVINNEYCPLNNHVVSSNLS